MGAASSVLAAVPERTPGKKFAGIGKLSLANELLGTAAYSACDLAWCPEPPGHYIEPSFGDTFY